jgi:archaellum biogenesis protein FlaJ (TadC family)
MLLILVLIPLILAAAICFFIAMGLIQIIKPIWKKSNKKEKKVTKTIYID